jgi:hypothetical protein
LIPDLALFFYVRKLFFPYGVAVAVSEAEEERAFQKFGMISLSKVHPHILSFISALS